MVATLTSGDESGVHVSSPGRQASGARCLRRAAAASTQAGEHRPRSPPGARSLPAPRRGLEGWREQTRGAAAGAGRVRDHGRPGRPGAGGTAARGDQGDPSMASPAPRQHQPARPEGRLTKRPAGPKPPGEGTGWTRVLPGRQALFRPRPALGQSGAAGRACGVARPDLDRGFPGPDHLAAPATAELPRRAPGRVHHRRPFLRRGVRPQEPRRTRRQPGSRAIRHPRPARRRHPGPAHRGRPARPPFRGGYRRVDRAGRPPHIFRHQDRA